MDALLDLLNDHPILLVLIAVFFVYVLVRDSVRLYLKKREQSILKQNVIDSERNIAKWMSEIQNSRETLMKNIQQIDAMTSDSILEQAQNLAETREKHKPKEKPLED